MVKKLWDDDEIGGRIYLQICNLFPEALLKNEKDRFFKHAFTVMHKLTATKYHIKNYQRIENEQFNHFKKAFKKDPGHTREAFELIFELEAFLFQIKSSLDMLVKLMNPVLGEGIVRTHTYSNKGDDLVKGLTQYKNKNGVKVSAVDDLIGLIKEDKQVWIDRVIQIRDRLNHVEGLSDYHFTPAKLPNGEIVPLKPKFDGTDTLKFMKTIYENNLGYHQDFMCLALAVIAPGLCLVPEETTRMNQAFGNHNSAQFVKWGWGMIQAPK